MLFLLQIDPANFEGLKSRLEQKDKEICALKQAAKVRNVCCCQNIWNQITDKNDMHININDSYKNIILDLG